MFAVRTQDLCPPAFAPGYPTAANVSATGFFVAALMTKPGATVRYIVGSAGAATG